MMSLCFLDTEFTDFRDPQFLSLGLAAVDGQELYLELGLQGADRGDTGTAWETGSRAGEWLLARAEATSTCVEVCFDYSTDWQLLADAVRDAGLWDRVREIVIPTNVDQLTSTLHGALAHEDCLQQVREQRGLRMHHPLADALALRAAYAAASAGIQQAVHGREKACRIFEERVLAQQPKRFAEARLRLWMMTRCAAAGDQPPYMVIHEPGLIDRLVDHISDHGY